MAKSNHSTVWFKGLTHSISYNVRTTKYNTIRTQHDVRGMQPNLKMNHQKYRGKSLEWLKMTIVLTVGFKGLTHSISYNVRTTTCTVLASAAQANTTPMQKPNSVTGQACLSSAVLTAHNILLPAGVISRCTAVIVPIVFRQERISFYPKRHHFVLSYCCTATYEK